MDGCRYWPHFGHEINVELNQIYAGWRKVTGQYDRGVDPGPLMPLSGPGLLNFCAGVSMESPEGLAL